MITLMFIASTWWIFALVFGICAIWAGIMFFQYGDFLEKFLSVIFILVGLALIFIVLLMKFHLF